MKLEIFLKSRFQDLVCKNQSQNDCNQKWSNFQSPNSLHKIYGE